MLTLFILQLRKSEMSFVCFVQMAGNPDQQEDALDEQYQEEGDDEVW